MQDLLATQALIAQRLVLNRPFAAWRPPLANRVLTLEGHVKVFDPNKDLEGFLFHPYNKHQLPPLLITKGNRPEADILRPAEQPLPQNPGIIADYEGYSQQLSEVLNGIRQGKVAKLVLSRIVKAPGLAAERAAEAFVALCQRYPEAFVYLFSDGGQNRWMGATPETLVGFDGDEGYTVSLAGTLRAGHGMVWTDKEKIEQQIVTDYILQRLSQAGALDLKAGRAEEVAAGNLLHLKTRIRFRMPEQLQRYDVVEALHPTPAVCGTPRNEAQQLIAAIEKHSRAYYTGFLGFWSANKTTQLFVNLRCMQFAEQNSLLYVGGGITADSVAEREWAETQWKAETLSWLFAAK